MQPQRIDHVAFWVAHRDAVAAALLARLPWHEIDRQQTFTLLGADARGFKLTLFDAEGPRGLGAFSHIALRVSSGVDEFHAGEGIRIQLVKVPTKVEYDLDHIALRARDPLATAVEYERYGFRRLGTRAKAGSAWIELVRGNPTVPERPLLNHIAVLVDSTDEHVAAAEARGIEIESLVDAPNTYAAFLRGPDGVRLEYVEHKPTFSLT
jgi:catechol 2,3-dioxygenase-like lactoylglutathione lyase family enzyme